MSRCNTRNDLLNTVGLKHSEKQNYTTHDEDPNQEHTKTRKSECYETTTQATQLPGYRELSKGQRQ